MNTYEIEISNTQSHLPVDEDFLAEVVRRTLAAEQVAAAEISLVLLDNAAIHELNRQYLQHDYPTDVLSFVLASDEPDPDAASQGFRGAGKRLEGEVIISAEMAVQQAAEYHWSPREELVLYLVHGLLHLCGYDDQSPTERALMRSREADILRNWNMRPHASTAEPADEHRSPSADGTSGAET